MKDRRRTHAVFLDRDGVINVYRRGYVRSWNQFVFQQGSIEAITALAQNGFSIVVVTNQSAIGRHFVTRGVVEDIHRRMVAEIERVSGIAVQVFCCPHAPEDGCACRKPSPGLVLQAAREMGLNLAKSYLVGDSLDDIRAGQKAGCTTLLVRTGRGAAEGARLTELESQPILVADLLAAAHWILAHQAIPTP